MSIEQSDIKHMMHPFTHLGVHEQEGPVVIERGEGVYIYDSKGNKLLDGMSGLWCVSLGYSQERMIKAAHDQMQKLPYYHIFNHKTHPKAVELTETLLNILPASPVYGPMQKIFYASSGSEANDSVVKLIRFYNNYRGKPQKKKIISRIEGYHGSTAMAASLTGTYPMHEYFDLPLEGILHTDCPHYYGYAEQGESEEAFCDRIISNLENMILKEGPDTIAAMFAEPVMAAGGVIVPPKGYFEKLQTLLRKHDILLVADEVVTGFGRTGQLFGCHTFNIEPDIIVMAKGLSSAYAPISAIGMPSMIYDALRDKCKDFGVFGHGFTSSAHPVSAAVALEAIKITLEQDLANHVSTLAPAFHEKLKAAEKSPIIGEMRGIGFLAAAHLVEDKKTRKQFPIDKRVPLYLMNAAQKHGVIIRAIGNNIAFCPPLIANEEHLDTIADAFFKALKETEQWLGVA